MKLVFNYIESRGEIIHLFMKTLHYNLENIYEFCLVQGAIIYYSSFCRFKTHSRIVLAYNYIETHVEIIYVFMKTEYNNAGYSFCYR